MPLPRILALAALACAMALPAQADGDRHHHHHGGGHWSGSWVIGLPWVYGPGYYGPGYYGYGPGYGWGTVYGYPGPWERQVIIERERAPEPEMPSGPPPAALWYYCDSAGTYYPYVSTCPEPWREVPAEPAAP